MKCCIAGLLVVVAIAGCDKTEPKPTDSQENLSASIDSGSTNVADIPKHIADFQDNSENGMVQARAMYALVKIGAPAVAPLIKALDSDNVDTRLNARSTRAES